MKERPIIFSAPIVRAILDGRKTQTRRVVKPQPPDGWFAPEEGIAWRGEEAGFCGRQRVQVMGSNGEADVDVEVIAFPVQRCPYGVPGDRLWVREAWRVFGGREYEYQQGRETVIYREGAELVDSVQGPWRPSIHMPRWASRITLEIVAVRVERLQEITEADAIAEGVESDDYLDRQEHFDSVAPPGSSGRPHPVTEFARLWDSINAKRAPWESNPWAWVIEFRVIEREARK